MWTRPSRMMLKRRGHSGLLHGIKVADLESQEHEREPEGCRLPLYLNLKKYVHLYLYVLIFICEVWGYVVLAVGRIDASMGRVFCTHPHHFMNFLAKVLELINAEKHESLHQN